MDRVSRVDVYAYGPRGLLHGRARIPEHLVSDIPALFARAHALNPAVDLDAFVRTMVRLGLVAVRRNNERRVPIRWADLPHARQAKDAETGYPRPQMDARSGLRPSRI